MQCLLLLRKKGRSKRLYSQANLSAAENIQNEEKKIQPDLTISQAQSNLEILPPIKPAEKIEEQKSQENPQISTENKNPQILPDSIPVLNPIPKNEEIKILTTSDPKNSSPIIINPENLPISTPKNIIDSKTIFKPYIELNNDLELQSLLNILEIIKGKKCPSESRKIKLTITKVLINPCILPPFEDSIHNEKKICLEIWKTRREQANQILKENILKPSFAICNYFIALESRQIIEICDSYQTRAEKIISQRSTKHDPKNEISKTIINCSDILSNLYFFNISKRV